MGKQNIQAKEVYTQVNFQNFCLPILFWSTVHILQTLNPEIAKLNRHVHLGIDCIRNTL